MNELNAEGKPHGTWWEYHPNGKLRWKYNYVNGKFHGSYESYYTNGNVSYKGFYQNNQRIGFWLDGNWDGRIRKEFHL